MTDGGEPGEAAQRRLVEDLRNEAHRGEAVNRAPLGGGDPRRFLAAVLECVKPEEGEASYILAGSVYAEDAALLADQVRR